MSNRYWQVLFDDHLPWSASILIGEEYPSYNNSDALDEAADSDEGQKYKMADCDLADFKTDEERDEYCCYLGNASDPFARENLAIRQVTLAQVIESGAPLRFANRNGPDWETVAKDLIAYLESQREGGKR